MNHHIHHVRGRLRIRTFQLKGRADRADAVLAGLRRAHGIRSAQANVITGSLLVYYDPAQTDASTVIAAVERLLPLGDPTPALASCGRTRRSEASRFERKVAEAMFWYAVEKAVERAAPLVLSALL